MKLCILAGGLGTRLAEETEYIPKPMVEIGGQPIILHIMKYYSVFGFKSFIILAGYRINSIRDFFKDYALKTSRVMSIETNSGQISHTGGKTEDWSIQVVDTGVNTMTGSRILQSKDLIGNKPFALTYGDGLCDVNIHKLLEFHHKNKFTVSLTSVQPESRFGSLDIDYRGCVSQFIEKPKDEGGWINGGFMVCEPKIFNYIKSTYNSVLETDVLKEVARNGELGAFKHYDFWRPMDTLRDKQILEKIYSEGNAPWKKW